MVALWIFAALAAPPQRIVSTAPAITETLYALGLGERVVGVTTYCRYPPEAARKPKVGAFTQPDLETIAGLRPDLVIVQQNPVRLAERLESLHLRTLEVSHASVAEILRSIEKIAAAGGVPGRAQALNASIRAQLDAVRERATALPPRRVMFVVGRTPGALEGLVTVSAGSYLDEALALAGGRNIFAGAATPYPKVALEEVLARNPEVIIDMGDMTATAGVTEAYKRAVVTLWDRWPSLAAVTQRRVYAVASDIFVVPGPRVVEAVREFFRMIHPEAGR